MGAGVIQSDGEHQRIAIQSSNPNGLFFSHEWVERPVCSETLDNFEPEHVAGFKWNSWHPFHRNGWLDLPEYAVEIGVDVPAQLEVYLGVPPSAGGARPKATVRDEKGVLWLAKFPAVGDSEDVAIKEIAALKLAESAGLTVPPLRHEVIAGKSVMLIRRFDRYWAVPGHTLPSGTWGYDTDPAPGLVEGRIHQISALTLLGCAELDSPTKSYADIARAIRSYCHPRYIAQNNRELFARMVFNIFVSNDDDHLRNHAFLYDAAAKGWRLSPLYDVVPMARVSQERRLHLDVGREGKLATLDNALSEHTAFLPSRADAIEVIRTVWGALRSWKQVFEECGADDGLVAKMTGAIRPLKDIASPDLERAIRGPR